MRRRALLTSATMLLSLTGCAMLAGDRQYDSVTETDSGRASVPCPNYFSSTTSTVCGTPPEGAPPVSLTVDGRELRVGTDGESPPAIIATFENGLSRPIGLAVQALQRYDDGEWNHVTGWSGDGLRTIDAGSTLRWSLSTEPHDTSDDVTPVVHSFQAGTWAYTVIVDVAPDEDRRSDVELSAVFSVVKK